MMFARIGIKILGADEVDAVECIIVFKGTIKGFLE